MTKTSLTRGKLARALELLGRAPARRPLPEKTERIAGAPSARVTPDVDEHLVAVGERARSVTKASSK